MPPRSMASVFCVSSLQGLFVQSHWSQKQKLSGDHAMQVHVLLLQTWGPWSDVPVGFAQQLNVGPVSQPSPPSDGRPGCQRCLPELCLIAPDSAGTGCSSFGTLRLRSKHLLSSLCFPPLLLGS